MSKQKDPQIFLFGRANVNLQKPRRTKLGGGWGSTLQWQLNFNPQKPSKTISTQEATSAYPTEAMAMAIYRNPAESHDTETEVNIPAFRGGGENF